MNKNKMGRILSIIVILTIIAYNLLGIISNKTYATDTTDVEISNIDDAIYPGIKTMLQELKKKYPKWEFKILYTNLDWNEVIIQEYTGHNSGPRNQVEAITNYQGAWICPICTYKNRNWRCASQDAIKYMMDPRNSLNESDIFQFEELTYNGHDVNAINNMVKGTFLEGHGQEIINASTTTKINPYYVIARVFQEQGKQGSVLVSGEKGVYNPFNIGATGTNANQEITNGVNYAKNQGWTTLEKGLVGGIEFVAKGYINRGQNTLYLQKFDVDSKYDGLYWHQYQQNLLAAQSEGSTLRKTYAGIDAINSEHTFVIPVYKNMPKTACPRPNGIVGPTVSGDVVRVNVNSTISLRSSPNGEKISSILYKDEIVTRIEKATSKVAGTYWDKVRKAEGTEAYVARETYDYETTYKLYLVPVNSNGTDTTPPNQNNGESSGETNSGNNGQTGNENNQVIKDTDKVKVDEKAKIIIVKPEAIAQDILDACGGPVKIVKADGSFLENEKSVIGTGYKVKDIYTVVKRGDINGEGTVTPSDYVLIKNNILEILKLKDIQKRAADFNEDENITPSDYVLVKNSILYGNAT